MASIRYQYKVYSMASKPTNIRWIRTGSRPYWKIRYRIVSYFNIRFSTNIEIKINVKTSFVNLIDNFLNRPSPIQMWTKKNNKMILLQVIKCTLRKVTKKLQFNSLWIKFKKFWWIILNFRWFIYLIMFVNNTWHYRISLCHYSGIFSYMTL